MGFGRFRRGMWLASVVSGALLTSGGALQAATFPEFVDPNPAPGNQFGQTVVALSTGNVVITSPFDDFGGTDAGAVYLFNGATGALISTLRGSTAGDRIGDAPRAPECPTAACPRRRSVTALANGNFVVVSPSWDNGAIADAGAATWGSGTSGVSGTISAANSLVGSAAGDQVGSGGVAVTGVTALANGNYVVASPNWDNGAIANVGAVSWGSGTSGVSGTVSAANSLVGSAAGDQVGFGVTALANGNYVVASPFWDNGAIASAGAVTWGSGTSGVSGAVSAANSLVGSAPGDVVGLNGVTALTNGNYVVESPSWDNGAIANAGAATWGSGTSGVSGTVSALNSLVGSTADDNVGARVTPLTNGNYVVASSNWDNGAIANAGAASWGSGTSGVSGTISAANSLVGSAAGDLVGAVTPLANGNYVVASSNWDNGAIADAGAVTWGSGTTGVSGVVSAANSLVGSVASDGVGYNGVSALANGNYVVRSQFWDNGAIVDAGAATWVSGTSGVIGTISAANSLVGSQANDQVGNGVIALANGNYVVASPFWDNGAVFNAGAASWGSGTSGVSGVISAANSLVGSNADDEVGGATALANGNYVVRSWLWDSGAIVNAGAVTWGSGTSGVSGTVSAANSLVGSTANDNVGIGMTAFANGNYVVASPSWDDGAVFNAGAASWGSGTSGVSGAVSAASSLIGTTASSGLENLVVEDRVNGTFYASFVTEGGGRVRVGQADPPVILSAVDIPDDQGGWLRLTFERSALDDAAGLPPVATYGVWRHVPGTLHARAGRVDPSAAPEARASDRERLRALLPAGLEAREVDGRLYVTGSGARSLEMAAAFPPGTWALVTSVPAVQQAQYLVEVPTISNAAPNDYVVTAHTTTPSMWFISTTISGQSVDNLAPAQPTGLSAAYVSGQTNLQWAANPEHDLGAYRLYRGATAGFTPAPGNLIASQIALAYADVGPAGSYYKLSAIDVNGNESSFALITPQQTAGAGEGASVAFALHGARPNPATGRALRVAFALPNAAPARLELHDMAGRRVAAREVGGLGAGQHVVNLAEGLQVAPGHYWVRLTQGTQHQRAQVAVTR